MPSNRRASVWQTISGRPESDPDAVFLDSGRCACSLRGQQPSGRRACYKDDRRREAGDDAVYQRLRGNPQITAPSPIPHPSSAWLPAPASLGNQDDGNHAFRNRSNPFCVRPTMGKQGVRCSDRHGKCKRRIRPGFLDCVPFRRAVGLVNRGDFESDGIIQVEDHENWCLRARGESGEVAVVIQQGILALGHGNLIPKPSNASSRCFCNSFFGTLAMSQRRP